MMTRASVDVPQPLSPTIASVSPGADGLLLLPYFTGESVPRLPDGTGVLHGITPENFTPAHMARAAAEGVALGLGYAMSRLRDLGFDQPAHLKHTSGDSAEFVVELRGQMFTAHGGSFESPGLLSVSRIINRSVR